jgi:hypothetical protein
VCPSPSDFCKGKKFSCGIYVYLTSELKRKTISGTTYAYPTYINIKILVRDWFVPHQVICLEETVFMCHICIIYVYNIVLHILTSTYWLETGVSLTKWFVLRKKCWCVIHVQVYVLSMYIHVYPTTYFNIKILVRDWCVPHQVIFVKEKSFHVAYMYILLTQLNIRIIRGCVC